GAKVGAPSRQPASQLKPPATDQQQLPDGGQQVLYFVEQIPVGSTATKSSNCPELPEGDNRLLSASDIAQLMGTVTPFSLKPRGDRMLLVYSKRPPPDGKNAADPDNTLLKKVEA